MQTLAARGLEEPCASFPDFWDNRQFHVIEVEGILVTFETCNHRNEYQ